MNKIKEHLFILPPVLCLAFLITAIIAGHTDNEGLMGLSVLLGLAFIFVGIILVRLDNNKK